MKHKMILTGLLSSFLGFAQAPVVKEVTKSMSKGLQPGIEVSLADVSKDNLEDAIDKETKSYKGKTRNVKKSNEFFIDDAFIEEISSNTIDIYQSIEKESEGLKYTVYFDLGGVFLSKSYGSEKYNYAFSLVQRIANKAVEYRSQDVLKEENKNLDTLEDDKKALEKANEKAAKEIEDANDLISNKTKEIEENKKLIENKAEEIKKQSKLIDRIKK